MEITTIRTIAAVAGIFIVVYFLWEAFETVVLPRTVTRGWRFTRSFYRALWTHVWQRTARRMRDFRTSDTFLSFFGPLSLILLLGVWAWALIIGFGLIQWGLNSSLNGAGQHPSLGAYLYFSGTTFYTLGYGDITPVDGLGRLVAVIEAGMGFGFLGIIIGYLPVLYAAFSRREAGQTLLDARAGSPPTSLEMLRRHSKAGAMPDLQLLLRGLEGWCADILESHLSYPNLAYYRSQHDDQSWLSALMVSMDTCAILMTGLEGVPSWQAQLTFAMGRHALIDFSLIFMTDPAENYLSRLTPPDMERIIRGLKECGISFQDEATAPERLNALRKTYEPYAVALARLLLFPLPPFAPTHDAAADDWQRSAWEQETHF